MQRVSRFLFTILLILFLLVGLALLIKTMPESFWNNPLGRAAEKIGLGYDAVDTKWIQDFQTAIAATLAILAAAVTVQAMFQIDELAERRHRQLVSLALRSDALKVERMLIPHFDILRGMVRSIEEHEFVSIQEVLVGTKKAKADAVFLCNQAVEAYKVLAGEDWIKAKDLMSGELNWSYKQLSELLITMANRVGMFENNYRSIEATSNPLPDEQRKRLQVDMGENWEGALHDLRRLPSIFKKFEDDVSELRKVYSDVSRFTNQRVS